MPKKMGPKATVDPVTVAPKGQTAYRHECSENDNHIVVYFESGELDEIQFGDVLEKGRAVIGGKDLSDALARSGYRIAKMEAASAAS